MDALERQRAKKSRPPGSGISSEALRAWALCGALVLG